ncbi:MAG: glycosyltransferase [candidate division KSB1 bacterium]|nr:glycosyltransferase [candidate division KSB1 bacterium]MDZ7335471.1 glycosyltransferase [candidate division KSB1 bacterium]MDZ7357654.1 glycosyltransferase [candidate division KSB1 bacterium]MDZ7377286.1 glycosyltransferase [candidate division KSB1 bacterium]MDZ7399202.1 glycosyltransferase [candidate division KSB1 bacterium]
MKISVIITIYNRAHLLTKCLWSLRFQTLVPHELILTDDGSEEDILGPIQSIIRGFSFSVKYVSQKHQGFRLAKCRNNGARHATGDYFIFIDQDIVLNRSFLEICVKERRERRFCVSYPVRLTADQSQLVTPELIERGDWQGIVTEAQRQKIKRQYVKDKFYQIIRSLHLLHRGPKLRGGAVAINRDDFVAINGYDENYQGWGNEDDDLGRRLYAAGIRGKNPFCNEFPLHLFHAPHHQNGTRVNLTYYRQRINAINRGEFRCQYGLDNPLGNEELVIRNLN